MKITNQKTLFGPNVYHNRPVILSRIDLEEKAEIGSHQVPKFTDRLVSAFPGLKIHRCSPGYEGGFVERLHRGTYFAHIVEHVALELSTLAGIDVAYGRAIYGGAPGQYCVVTRFKNEEGMKFLVKAAVAFVDCLFSGMKFDLGDVIGEAKEIISHTALGPSTAALVAAAERRNIPWRQIGKGSLIELGYGRNRRRIQAAVTENTNLIATDIAQDKALTKQVLREAFIPVPAGSVVNDIEEARLFLEREASPIAVKPLNGHHGNGVSLNITSADDLDKAFALAQEFDSKVLIEEMRGGRDFRIMVLNGAVAAAAERIPPEVTGDGKKTISNLIDQMNQDPRRGDGHSNVLTKISVDPVLERYLSRRGLTLSTIPGPGQVVQLRENANLSTGGTARDVTSILHPEIALLCVRAARAVGLDICGVDLIHNDITQPPNAETAILEVNAGPGLRMHLAPSEGSSRNVALMIVDSLYPPARNARIPIVAVTGTNGKTTTARMVCHILHAANFGTIGLTSSDGIRIDSKFVSRGDTTGPNSSRLVLSDPTVDVAVLEVARGGLVRGGLGYDWSDVGIVTNIRLDHVGQDGIEDIDDIVRIKSVIPERVREGGTIVLNADDEETSRLMEIPRLRKIEREIIYYSVKNDHPLLRNSKCAFFVKDGFITESNGNREHRLVAVRDLSFTFAGKAAFQVSNALAAAAAARAMGVSRDFVGRALLTFRNSRDNLGRLNIYRVRHGFFVLDYGHNPYAIETISSLIRAHGKKSTTILGLPGDRTNELIEESSRIAARGFDRIFIRQDCDLRGRKPGEVPALIFKTVKRILSSKECQIMSSEEDAIRTAIRTMKRDEVCVLFYDEYGPAMRILKEFDPVPVESFEELPEIHSSDEQESPRRNAISLGGNYHGRTRGL